MMFSRIFAVYLRQLFLLRRSPGRLIGIFYWSTVELLLWGFLTVYLNDIGRTRFDFVTVMLGAFIFWDFFIRSQHGLTVSFLEDVWMRNFANLFASPLRMREYLAGLIVTSVTQSLITVVLVSVLALLFFNFNILQIGPLLVPYIIVLFAFGWALGIATIAIVLRFGPSAEIFAWSIPFLFQPISAVFYPVEALPIWLQPISRALPTTHIFEGMRSIVLGSGADAGRLLIAILLTALYLVAAVGIFALVFRRARERGFLVRFTTE